MDTKSIGKNIAILRKEMGTRRRLWLKNWAFRRKPSANGKLVRDCQMYVLEIGDEGKPTITDRDTISSEESCM
jgi:hypothetical protein